MIDRKIEKTMDETHRISMIPEFPGSVLRHEYFSLIVDSLANNGVKTNVT